MTTRTIGEVSSSSVCFETNSLRIKTKEGQDIRIDAVAALVMRLNPHSLTRGKRIAIDRCNKSGKILYAQKL